MSQITSQVKTREQRGGEVPAAAGLAPIPQATLARRRRLVNLAGILGLIGGLGLSTIPGPKGSSYVKITETERGVTTVVHKYTYHRTYGVPFVVARAELEENGEMKKLSIDGKDSLGIVGNMAVAIGVVLILSLFFRRRPDPNP
jgi:hypothetical protein